ncbi:MAG: response regulator [Bacteroidia bacterium]|nr:response regulator [Bacteroidia bacterium]NNM21931.1 response regulator [Flavobacteriaceae bacterium]
MKTLLNRFKTKNELVGIDVDSPKDTRGSFIEFFIDKGSYNFQREQISIRLEAFQFPENEYWANLCLVKFYLEIEDHLVVKDPGFTGGASQLRADIKTNFPEIAASEAFLPLFEEKKNQEILLVCNLLKFLLTGFIDDPKSESKASRWLEVLKYRLKERTSDELVQQINTLTKLRDHSKEIYKDFVDSFGFEWTNEIIDKQHQAFIEFYPSLNISRMLQEYNPIEHTEIDVPKPRMAAIKAVKGDHKKQSSQLINKRSIIEHILDGFVVINRKGNILDYNRNTLEILGLSETSVKRNSIFDFFPFEFTTSFKADFNKTDPATPNQVIGRRHEIVLERTGNEVVDYEIAVTNNYSEGEDTYTLLLKNITDKRDTIKAINEAKANAERTAKAKSTFLSNMSHEIRTPLNVILGLSEIIKKSDLEDTTLLRKNVDGIDFSAKNLLSIVNDILDFSKIEAGKLTIQSIDFNLKKLVASLSDGFEIKAREKGLNLIYEIDKNVPDVVIGDQYRLNQILSNLISNAIKFTKSGQISISVSNVAAKGEQLQLQFKVQDSGIGIAEDKLDKIFESFFQLEDQESLKETGTGLGLAITKELIKLQHGTLHATSVVGEGSTFEFTLPFVKSKLKGIATKVTKQEREIAKLEGLKVLVAEDNKMNQFYINQLLHSFKVDVDIAENGQEAVEIFERADFHYDLVLMDMHMPFMNGIEAITEIRSTKKYRQKKVPIVACSADVFPEARKNAIKAGIDFYLTKPLNEDAVKEVLFWLISDQVADPTIVLDELSKKKDNESRNSSVDMTLLKETFDNDEEFIIELLEVFVKTTPEDYKSLRTCMDREYYVRASSLAHKMKSSFMNLGMTTHGHHLQIIESNVATKDGLEEAKKHMTAFSNMYTKALLEVNILLIELKQK